MKPLIIIAMLFTAVGARGNGDYPKREMRAVWIATVSNIDWASKSGIAPELQQQEMIELLNLVKEYNMNTVVFQVRPAADAFYDSRHEPWSYWLTGTQGKAPAPYYDPLHFTIAEARKRGINVHVWLNPYRAIVDNERMTVAPDHITQTRPELFVHYGKTTCFNPALAETRNHIASVVADIVRRYDIDAIHFDDYFYPYPIAGEEFPDHNAFVNDPRGFSPQQKADWRRDNVNLIIRQIHDTIQSIKPYVEFGVSPFGVWRNAANDPKGSLTKAGVTCYDDLYADILTWQRKGWVDYVTPQIYWHIGKDAADYATIADWWSRNSFGCQLYVGHSIYRIGRESGDKAWRTPKELVKQVELNRTYSNISGSFFFSAKVLRRNPLNMKRHLMRRLYRYPALPPVNARVEQQLPTPPTDVKLEIINNKIVINWERSRSNKLFVVYKVKKGRDVSVENAEDIVIITSANRVYVDLTRTTHPKRYNYVVTALSASNMESLPAEPTITNK
ncbi:MAG: family 10 glycosylhydrolase [Cytophagaceae bacterium]|jgi:uncharacterized lipoprotein YddW (UPF0748 family)|nr:family 10 glycosylhydrolase [Cytophagaceae bacterium]